MLLSVDKLMYTWICYPKEKLGFFFLVGDVAVNLKS